MKNTFRLISLLVILLILIGTSAACTSGSSSATYESTIRDYADPATETTLQGLSEGNLAKYTQNANSEFKAAVTQDIIDKTATQINSQLGDYVSKEFLSIEEQEGFIIVHYKAEFTKGGVGVRMIFDQNHLVTGQWFE